MFTTYTLRLIGLLGLYFTNGSQAETTLIKNVTIINEYAELLEQPKNILIIDEIISKIGNFDTQADHIIDGQGKYLIPGLIDSHVHLKGVPGLRVDSVKDQELQRDGAKQIPRSYLYFGFTTVLDLASYSSFVSQWNAQVYAPEALYCTAMSILNGYPIVYSGEAASQLSSPMASYLLYDKNQSDEYPADYPVKEHLPEHLVKKAKKEGAICIKTFYEKGFGVKKNLPVPDLDLIRELKLYASQENMPLFLHANSTDAYQFASQTNVSVLAHGLWHSNGNDIKPLIKDIAHQDISVQLTLTVVEGELDLFDHSFFSSEEAHSAIPSSLINWYKSESGQWFKKILSSNVLNLQNNKQHETMKKKYDHVFQTLRKGVHSLLENNVNLVFGSDTPSGPIYTQFPGLNGFREIQAWARTGVDLKTLFKSLTIRNAELLGVQNRIGAIREGMQADLLLLNENPLVDVQAYNSIQTVFIDGLAIDRESLAAK
ncbi:MAG: amidohydrolase family protein [Paraglaciecola sp.]|uniref:amidohydrolase family protein n=1 Tax=Paraglaciecola sp. TaxID=1920173 RepID=UPI003263B384